MTSPVIAPSILAADATRFGEETKRVEEAGADWLHVDVMDGRFVPNISIGPAVTAALRRSTRLPLDVHLMVEEPDQYVDAFLKAGASRITVHVEARHNVRETIRRIRKGECSAGIALSPPTAHTAALPYLEEVDLVLCMTVVPGFGGQEFMPEVLDKIRNLSAHPARRKNFYYIEVDGGINTETAAACACAGANAFVSGSHLFHAKDLKGAVAEMRKAARAAMQKGD